MTGESKPHRARESQTARAQRYQAAMRRVVDMPDHNFWWDVARTMLGYVLIGDTPEEAERKARADYGDDGE